MLYTYVNIFHVHAWNICSYTGTGGTVLGAGGVPGGTGTGVLPGGGESDANFILLQMFMILRLCLIFSSYSCLIHLKCEILDFPKGLIQFYLSM